MKSRKTVIKDTQTVLYKLKIHFLEIKQQQFKQNIRILNFLKFISSKITNKNLHLEFSSIFFYSVLPLTSVTIDSRATVEACAHSRPLLDAMKYQPDKNSEFRIFSKKDKKFLTDTWQGDPMLTVHMVQAFQDKNDPKVIYLDTSVAGNADVIGDFYYSVSNQKKLILDINL